MANVKNFIEFGGDAEEAVQATQKFGKAIDNQAEGIVKLSKVVETVFPKIKRVIEDSLGNSRTVNANPIKRVEEGVSASGAKVVQTITKHGIKILSITKKISVDIEKSEKESAARQAELWAEGRSGIVEWSKAQRKVAREQEKLWADGEAGIRKWSKAVRAAVKEQERLRELTNNGAMASGEDKFTGRRNYENTWEKLLQAEDERLRQDGLRGISEWSKTKRAAAKEAKRLAKEQADEEERLRQDGLRGIAEWSKAKRVAAREARRLAREQAAEDERLRQDALQGIREWSTARRNAAREARRLAREQAAEEERLRQDGLRGIREWSAARRNATRQTNRAAAGGAGDHLVGMMGGVPANATLAGRASIASITTSLENMIARGRVSRAVMMELYEAIRYNGMAAFLLRQGIGALTPEMKSAEAAIRRLIAAQANLTNAGRRTTEMLISFRGAMRILAVQQLHNIIRQLSNAFTTTSSEAAEFYKSIGLIQTITQDSANSTKSWANSLRDLSSEFNIELLDASAAAYEAISNQIVDGTNATLFLGKAFEFAKITGSTAKDAVNLLSSAINGFALNANYTDEITAKLFKTIDVGRVTASQMANVLGNVAPTAHLAGISLDELMAGIATLTREGVRADTSITLMNNIITSMIKPSDELAATIKSWGYESGQAAIQGLRFHGVLRKLLEEEQKGGASRLGELFPNIRSLRAAIGLTQDFSTSYSKSLLEISNASTEAGKATQIMGENTGVAFQRIQKSLSNTMVTRFGVELMEIIVDLDKNFNGLSVTIVPLVDGLSNVAHLGADIVNIFAMVDKNTVGVTKSLSKVIPAIAAMTASYYALGPIIQMVTVRQEFLTAQMNNVAVANRANVTWFNQARVALLGYTLNANGAAVANVALATSTAMLTAGIPLAIGALAYIVSYSYDVRREIDNMEEEIIGRLNKIYEKGIDSFIKNIQERNKVLTIGLEQEMRALTKYQAFVSRIINQNTTLPNVKQFGADLNDAKGIDDTASRFAALARIIAETKDKAGKLALLGDIDGAGKAYDELVKAAKDFNNELDKTAAKIDDSIARLTDKKEDSLLEKKLFGKEGAAKNKVLLTEFNRLMAEANAADSVEEGLKLAGKAQEVAGKMDTTGKGKSNKRFDLEVQAIELQLKLQQELKNNLPDRIKQNTLLTEQEAQQKRILDLKIQERDAAQKILEIQQALFKEQDARTLAHTNAVEKRSGLEQKISGGVQQSNAAINERNFFGGETDRAVAFRHIDEKYNKFVSDMSELSKDLEHAIAIGDSAKANLIRKQLGQRGAIAQQLINQQANAANPSNGMGGTLLTKEEFELEKARRKEILELFKEYAAANSAVGTTGAGLTEVQGAIDRARLETQVALQGMQGLKDLYKDIWADIGAGVNAPMNDLKLTVDNLGASIKNLKAALDGQLGAAGKPTKASGGRIGRDGSVANFDPKEFVTNPMASQRFGPQLAAMNSNFNGGGSSSSSIVNVGDVHVNQYGNKTGEQTGDEIGRSIRRRIARGTVRLT